MSTAGVIVAAGRGHRLGGAHPEAVHTARWGLRPAAIG